MLFKMDVPYNTRPKQHSQLKVDTLRKFDKAMRLRGLNRVPKCSSQKSTYSFFEDNYADINVLDEATDEEDINSSCGESRADDCGDDGSLIAVEKLMMAGGGIYNNPEDGLLEDIPDLEHECLDDSDVMMEEDEIITAEEHLPSPFNDNY